MHSQQESSSPSIPVALSSSSLPLGSSSVESAQAQVNQGTTISSNSSSNLTPVTSELPAVVSTITILPQSSPPETTEAEMKRSKVGRPRTKPQKEKTEWHQHLGGVRHCRYIPYSGKFLYGANFCIFHMFLLCAKINYKNLNVRNFRDIKNSA